MSDYYNPNPNTWWHGDEMHQTPTSTVDDVMQAIADKKCDKDGVDYREWLDEMISEDLAYKILIYIAANYYKPDLQPLVSMMEKHISETLESLS